MNRNKLNIDISHSKQNTRIKVCCRLRPIITEDYKLTNTVRNTTPETCVHLNKDGQSIKLIKDNYNSKIFNLDHTFNSSITQEEVYNLSYKNIVRDVINGYNGTGIVYGQTGSGKSYTLFGNNNNQDIDTSVIGNNSMSNNISNNNINYGIAYYAINDIFKAVKKYHDDGLVANIFVSFYQIYLENCYDLLSGKAQDNNNMGNIDISNTVAKVLQVKSDPDRGAYVENLQHVHVEDTESTMEVLKQGLRNRQVQATQYNIQSSRSHAIFQLYLDFEEDNNIGSEEVKKSGKNKCSSKSRKRADSGSSGMRSSTASSELSDIDESDDDYVGFDGTSENKQDLHFNVRRRMLTLVDLAGSERIQSYHVKSKKEMKEAVIINKSISALGNCIYALANISVNTNLTSTGNVRNNVLSSSNSSGIYSTGSGSSKHVPFRDCKLTRLLAEPLGGNSKTCIIVNIGPCAYNYEETYSTLKFALRAMAIKRTVKKSKLQKIRIKSEPPPPPPDPETVMEATLNKALSGSKDTSRNTDGGYLSAPENPTYLRHSNGYYVHPIHVPAQESIPISTYQQYDPQSGAVKFNLGEFLRACQKSPHVVPPMNTLVTTNSPSKIAQQSNGFHPDSSVPSYGFVQFDETFDPNSLYLSPVAQQTPRHPVLSPGFSATVERNASNELNTDNSRNYFHPAFSLRPPAPATLTPEAAAALVNEKLSFPTKSQPVSYVANSFMDDAGTDISSNFVNTFESSGPQITEVLLSPKASTIKNSKSQSAQLSHNASQMLLQPPQQMLNGPPVLMLPMHPYAMPLNTGFLPNPPPIYSPIAVAPKTPLSVKSFLSDDSATPEPEEPPPTMTEKPDISFELSPKRNNSNQTPKKNCSPPRKMNIGTVKSIGPYGIMQKKAFRTPSPLKTAKIMKEIREFRWPTPEPLSDQELAPEKSPNGTHSLYNSPDPSLLPLENNNNENSKDQVPIIETGKSVKEVPPAPAEVPNLILPNQATELESKDSIEEPVKTPPLLLRRKLDKRRPSYVNMVVHKLEQTKTMEPVVDSMKSLTPTPQQMEDLEAKWGEGLLETGVDSEGVTVAVLSRNSSRNNDSKGSDIRTINRLLPRQGIDKGTNSSSNVNSDAPVNSVLEGVAKVLDEQSDNKNNKNNKQAAPFLSPTATIKNYADRQDSSKALRAAVALESKQQVPQNTAITTPVTSRPFDFNEDTEGNSDENTTIRNSQDDDAVKNSLLTLVHDLRSQLQKRDEEITTLRSFILKY